MELWEIAMKVVAAVVAGGLVGLEREIAGKAAGIRTNILICLGATVMSLAGYTMSQELTVTQRIMADPARMGAGIITGIGFLGAGAIIQARGSVRGLTTAATIWVLAGVGVAIGVGQLELAAAGVVATIVTLAGIDRLEYWIVGTRMTVDYVIAAEPSATVLQAIRASAEDAGAKVFGLKVEKASNRMVVRFLARGAPAAHDELERALAGIARVHSVERSEEIG